MAFISPPSPEVAKLFAEMSARRARLVFVIDATASREEAWDAATTMQAAMFAEAAKLGALDVQLVYFGGDRLQATEWTSNPHTLSTTMRGIRCVSGQTQIEQALKHIRTENARQKIAAGIYVGDACEENPKNLFSRCGSGGAAVCFPRRQKSLPR
jgi:hypothetical protein